MATQVLDAVTAFREAGPRCFVNGHARTIYAIVSDDYVYPACGDHLGRAIKEVVNQYTPPIESVTVFWRQ